jgi:serine/threonine protein kinase
MTPDKMTPERWQKVEEAFETAIELPSAEREAFLTRVCNGDAELRAEIASLLANEVEETFFQSAVAGGAKTFARAAAEEFVGQRIGVYRITGMIGQGGMGAVYSAVRDDDQFNQQVAIKIIKRGMDSGFVLQRFRRERQILASLNHPNIAHLLDGGTTTDGRPYFVMEFIAGQPINEYCDNHQLSVADRLKLFRQVCAAVQYAHQNLIVHRDLKPGNILVTEDGTPKLLDFGIAKLLAADTGQAVTRTVTGLRLMTPDYASPEQVRGGTITTASDIYSLGTVLYELLTGRRAHQFKTYSPVEIEETVCSVEAEKPSEAAAPAPWRRQLAGDLDNIVLTALRKEPERRYQSVEQFSEDIRRHLEGLPVAARKDTLGYRASKFARRNKLAIAAVALVLLSLLGGVIVANRQARRAERRFQQVRNLANTFLFDIHDEIKKLPGSTQTRARVVGTALEYLDNLAREAADDPALIMDLAQAYDRVGRVLGDPSEENLGRGAAARASFQKALSLYDKLIEREPSNQGLLELSGLLNIRIGDLRSNEGNFAGMEQSYRAAMLVVERMKAARMEVDPSLESMAHHRMGEIARRAGDMQSAINSQRRGFEIVANWVARQPSGSDQSLMSSNYSRLGGMLFYLAGDLEGALEAFGQALRLSEEQAARSPANVRYRRVLIARHNDVARVMGDPDEPNLGRANEALAHYRQALAIAEKEAATDPDDTQAHESVGRASLWVAMMLRDSDPAAASASYRKALAVYEALSKSASENLSFRDYLALSQRGLGYSVWRLGRPHEGLEWLRKAIELQQANFALDPTRTINREMRRTHALTGDILLGLGDAGGALEIYRQALAVNEKFLANNPTDPGLRLGQVYCYESFARLHSTLAADRRLPRQQRVAAAREAFHWRQRGLQSWDQWLAQGLAQPYAARRREEAARDLAHCEAALARLEAR